MIGTLFDGLDELYHHAKFGEDRTMRAGCTCENMVFVCLFHLSRSMRRAVRSTGCIVRTIIALRFMDQL